MTAILLSPFGLVGESSSVVVLPLDPDIQPNWSSAKELWEEGHQYQQQR
jgi:hypothetical protein